jgi:hypothetical protein
MKPANVIELLFTGLNCPASLTGAASRSRQPGDLPCAGIVAFVCQSVGRLGRAFSILRRHRIAD